MILKSLQTRISLAAVVMVVVSIIFASGAALVLMRDAARDSAIEIAQGAAEAAARDVQLSFERALNVARQNAVVMGDLAERGVTDRDTHNGLMIARLDNTPEVLSTWVIWEPNALDGRDAEFRNTENHDATGRFIRYWARTGEGLLLDPLVQYDDPELGTWYTIPRDEAREFVTEPTLYPVDGVDVLMTSFCIPVRKDGVIAAVTGTDMALSDVQATLSQIRPMGSGVITLVSADGARHRGRA